MLCAFVLFCRVISVPYTWKAAFRISSRAFRSTYDACNGSSIHRNSVTFLFSFFVHTLLKWFVFLYTLMYTLYSLKYWSVLRCKQFGNKTELHSYCTAYMHYLFVLVVHYCLHFVFVEQIFCVLLFKKENCMIFQHILGKYLQCLCTVAHNDDDHFFVYLYWENIDFFVCRDSSFQSLQCKTKQIHSIADRSNNK